ncbi:hypothetical protein K504DRAFT_136679 [Pleomassaria siparia CBS 279.74]|uniref:Uncharacterized protein n=1 Tax=Pleomassaria siparia CBS 279.74 TaxID=1314801 RepID=A0A6G1KLY5_9PLEO|nr:hypothetical protein K504DRAFT_136679 [Pleomassaria siparia CBS 279.74]
MLRRPKEKKNPMTRAFADANATHIVLYILMLLHTYILRTTYTMSTKTGGFPSAVHLPFLYRRPTQTVLQTKVSSIWLAQDGSRLEVVKWAPRMPSHTACYPCAYKSYHAFRKQLTGMQRCSILVLHMKISLGYACVCGPSLADLSLSHESRGSEWGQVHMETMLQFKNMSTPTIPSMYVHTQYIRY